MKFSFLFIIIIFISKQGYCFDGQASQIVTVKDVREALVQIKQIEPSKYLDEISDYKRLINRYIEYKKLVCKGEFTTFIIGENMDASKPTKKKLSKQGMEICFRQLKNVHLDFVRGTFVARNIFIKKELMNLKK